MTRFDLHLHSNNSDGSDSVQELVQKVANAGIDIFALTDHDTVEGCFDIDKYLPENIKCIKGVELTCKLNDIKCHILGYGIDINNKSLTDLIEYGKELRRKKLETRINYLKEVWGIVLTENELSWLYSRKSVVKTHIANILVARGLSDNNVDAMKKYLDGCKSGDTRFDGIEAINVIKNAGGIPVWAHPLGGEGEEHISEREFFTQLKTMQKGGIEGLECYYSRYNKDEAEMLTDYAEKNGLLISAGSDYHGLNKTVKLGCLCSEGIYPDINKITLLKNLC